MTSSTLNTLTHRLIGPQPVATIALNVTYLGDGDRAGLAASEDTNSYNWQILSASSVKGLPLGIEPI